MKMSVLYFSKSGTTKEMAEMICQGMEQAGGVEARAFSIGAPGEGFDEGFDEGFIGESRCVVLGTPTYLASMAAEVKTFLDGPARKLGLAGKIGGAFATADYLHGGAELAISSILNHMLVLGMLVFSGGGSFGKPVIHLGPVALKQSKDEAKETFLLYGHRMAQKTKELFK